MLMCSQSDTGLPVQQSSISPQQKIRSNAVISKECTVRIQFEIGCAIDSCTSPYMYVVQVHL